MTPHERSERRPFGIHSQTRGERAGRVGVRGLYGKAHFRLNDAEFGAILWGYRFRVCAAWYVSDPMPVGSKMRFGHSLRGGI